MDKKTNLKMWAFIATRYKDVVECKEVNTQFGIRAIAIIHMNCRYRAVQKFHDENFKQAFGKKSPIYDVIHVQ